MHVNLQLSQNKNCKIIEFFNYKEIFKSLQKKNEAENITSTHLEEGDGVGGRGSHNSSGLRKNIDHTHGSTGQSDLPKVMFMGKMEMASPF